jgi:hypothetical protein
MKKILSIVLFYSLCKWVFTKQFVIRVIFHILSVQVQAVFCSFRKRCSKNSRQSQIQTTTTVNGLSGNDKFIVLVIHSKKHLLVTKVA